MILIVCVFSFVDLSAGELPGVLILANFGINLLSKHC
jgi:hypothetical protein